MIKALIHRFKKILSKAAVVLGPLLKLVAPLAGFAGSITDKLIYSFGLSLRKKLLIMFILISIPSLVFTGLTFIIINQTLSSQIDSSNKALVGSANKLVEHYILNCQKSITTLASEKNLRYKVSRRDEKLVQDELKRVYVKYKNFSFLGIVRKKEEKLYMLSSWPGSYKNLTDTKDIYSYLDMNFSHPKARISNTLTYKDRKEILFVYPMRGALLIGGVNLENLHSLLDKIKPVKKSSFMLLDKEDNYIIGHSGKLDDKIRISKGIMYSEKHKSISYFTQNEALGWKILLDTPYIVTYRSRIYLASLLLVFAVIGLLTAVMLAIYFSKKITLPISYMNKGARILGAGNLSYRIELKTGDELEELAGELNKMGEELQISYDSLGEKIKNATRDLEDAYKEIENKNRELQKADRLKSEFLASMSHELRTPMNAIIGFTTLLHDGIYGEVSEKQKTTYEKIMRNTKHLLNLINDILDLSKIEAGRMKLSPEKIKLGLLIADIRDEVKPLALEKGLDFELIEEEKIDCINDYTRLRQIIVNLISNAIKFTREGSVKIRIIKEKEYFIVEVEDTGIGIKTEEAEHVFDEFIQADGSITREFGGTGLGLSISKKLVGMMGGQLEFESEWGKGSLFRIKIPYDIKGETNENTDS